LSSIVILCSAADGTGFSVLSNINSVDFDDFVIAKSPITKLIDFRIVAMKKWDTPIDSALFYQW
jgi:hypothetical protein